MRLLKNMFCQCYRLSAKVTGEKDSAFDAILIICVMVNMYLTAIWGIGIIALKPYVVTFDDYTLIPEYISIIVGLTISFCIRNKRYISWLQDCDFQSKRSRLVVVLIFLGAPVALLSSFIIMQQHN